MTVYMWWREVAQVSIIYSQQITASYSTILRILLTQLSCRQQTYVYVPWTTALDDRGFAQLLFQYYLLNPCHLYTIFPAPRLHPVNTQIPKALHSHKVLSLSSGPIKRVFNGTTIDRWN